MDSNDDMHLFWEVHTISSFDCFLSHAYTSIQLKQMNAFAHCKNTNKSIEDIIMSSLDNVPMLRFSTTDTGTDLTSLVVVFNIHNF